MLHIISLYLIQKHSQDSPDISRALLNRDRVRCGRDEWDREKIRIFGSAPVYLKASNGHDRASLSVSARRT